MPAAKNNNNSTNIKIQTDIAVLKEQVGEIKRQTQTISDKMDKFSYVPLSEFNELKKELQLEYVTKEEFKPVRFVVYTVAGAILSTLAAGIMKLLLDGKI